MKNIRKILFVLLVLCAFSTGVIGALSLTQAYGNQDSSGSQIGYLPKFQQNFKSANNDPNDNPPVVKIRDSGRPDKDSIVIIIMGDGFTANDDEALCQQGRWDPQNPNPREGTVLWHADNAIKSLTATQPFNLFSHLFTVYVILVESEESGVNGYLGSVNDIGEFSTYVYLSTIATLADAVVDRHYQATIQIISNATNDGGISYCTWRYQTLIPNGVNASVNIAVTSIISKYNGGSTLLWPSGTFWHGTFIHELGHSFGHLADEYDQSQATYDERMANSTKSANASVKWRHWYGHNMVQTQPLRYTNEWAVPGGDCIMRSQGFRDFCGVCSAELIRRMAAISDEKFMGRHPSTNANPLVPNDLSITIPKGATRILDSAFHGNTTMQSITIPNTVEDRLENGIKIGDGIGDYAFLGATGLRTITNYATIPQQINNTTFANSGMNQLNRANITVIIPVDTTQAYRDAGWEDFELIEAGLVIANNIVTGFILPPDFDGHMDIPEDVAIIGNGTSVFGQYASQITSITIPNTVTTISANAFSGVMCSEIIIPASVTTIGENAFQNCTGLTNLTIPVGVKSVEANAFDGCTSLSIT